MGGLPLCLPLSLHFPFCSDRASVSRLSKGATPVGLKCSFSGSLCEPCRGLALSLQGKKLSVRAPPHRRWKLTPTASHTSSVSARG